MKYLSHVDKYLTLKYKYKYKYFEMVLEYYSSTSTSTKYYISGKYTLCTAILAIILRLQALESLSRDEEACARITRTQLHVDLMSNLRPNSQSTVVLSEPASIDQRQFVQTQLRILYNVARRSATGRNAFNIDCLDMLANLCQLTEYPVRFRTNHYCLYNRCHSLY